MKSFFIVLISATLTLSAQQYRETLIPTRVTNPEKKYLRADLYISDSTVRRPSILIQTPYNKLFYRISLNNPNPESGAAVPYDTAHYNYIIVDWRGFYTNLSADSLLYNRGLDGFDIVEWIASQSWSNGKVGTWGGSALGQIQFQTAAQQPPHLVCAAPFIKDFKTKYSDYYYGGDFRKEHVESLMKLGFISEKLILSHPTEDIYWKTAENITDISKKINVPMFLCSGWFDHYPSDVMRAFDDIRTNSDVGVRNKHKLLFGPWMHTALGVSEQGILDFPNAAGIPVEMGKKFFDYYLRKVQNGWETNVPIQYYQIGENIWKTTDNWGNENKGMRTLYFHEGKRLSFEPPPQTFRPIDPDTLRTDPRNPTPTIGGSRFNPFDKSIPLGPQDISNILDRGDIVSYSTEELASPITMDGISDIKIYFDCNRRDADISARLCDIYPDGRWVLLTQGIQRLRLRNSLSEEQLLTINALDSATIHLTDLAMTFLEGHRIGIVLSGSNYPMFDINPNNGGQLYASGDSLEAETHISLNSDAASCFRFSSGSAPLAISSDNIPMYNCKIIPNPAKDDVYLELPSFAAGNRVIVSDALGKVVTSSEITHQKEFRFSSAELPAGLYEVVIISGSNVQTLTLVIQR